MPSESNRRDKCILCDKETEYDEFEHIDIGAANDDEDMSISELHKAQKKDKPEDSQ